MEFELSSRKEAVSNLTDPVDGGRGGCNPLQGPEKSLVGVEVDLEALQSKDCQPTGYTGRIELKVNLGDF